MDELNSFPRNMKNTVTMLKLSDLNPHLMCVLCGGYYIDATTIVECLHSFCRSCIVKHLESSKYCPICEVQVHKTKPLINIRPDKTLQDIVYKLVPGLFANEMRNRRKFYRERPHYIKPNNSESIGEVSGDRKIYVSDENITFTLVYNVGSTVNNLDNCYKEISPFIQNEKRYFKCPTGVTIYHLKKLLKTKYELNDSNYKMEVYLKNQPLHDDLTLLDISYIHLCKNQKEQKGSSLDLTYKIFENIIKRQKLEEKESRKEPKKILDDFQTEINNLPKEVSMKKETENRRIESVVTEEKNEEVGSESTPSSAQSATINGMERSNSQVNQVPLADEPQNSESTNQNSDFRSIKENGVNGSESKEVQLQISESGVMIVSQVKDGEIVRTMEDAPSKVMNNQLITGLSLDANKEKKGKSEEIVQSETAVNRPGPEPGTATTAATASAPTGATTATTTTKPVSKSFKTIRCSPKTWHPVIPKEKLRPTLIKNTEEPKKPLKFFKMRNMPRFLGNPSSGVKPMYAEPQENSGGKGEGKDGKKSQVQQQQQQQQHQQQHQKGTSHKVQVQQPEISLPEKKSNSSKNKILKIDPKTLRPIEKDEMKVTQTPNVPNLLTNPFIPNNNHFLFSHLHLLPPPNPGNFGNNKTGGGKQTSFGAFKGASPNGGYPPICFPSPDHNSGFYPFTNLTKPQNFPFPVGDKMDPLLRASRLSPFSNLSGFNVAGFHASLPPSISRLLNPHQHFRKLSQNLEKKTSNKDESTKETTKTIRNNCDDSVKVNKGSEERKEEGDGVKKTTTTAAAAAVATKTVTSATKTMMTTTTTTTTTTTSATSATTAISITTMTMDGATKEAEDKKKEKVESLDTIMGAGAAAAEAKETGTCDRKEETNVETDKSDELTKEERVAGTDAGGGSGSSGGSSGGGGGGGDGDEIENKNKSQEKGEEVREGKSSESASEKIEKPESNSESDNKSIDKDK